jgi:hypothetical protein
MGASSGSTTATRSTMMACTAGQVVTLAPPGQKIDIARGSTTATQAAGGADGAAEITLLRVGQAGCPFGMEDGTISSPSLMMGASSGSTTATRSTMMACTAGQVVTLAPPGQKIARQRWPARLARRAPRRRYRARQARWHHVQVPRPRHRQQTGVPCPLSRMGQLPQHGQQAAQMVPRESLCCARRRGRRGRLARSWKQRGGLPRSHLETLDDLRCS